MKIFKLYLSFLKSFLKVGVKINILILLISITAVLSFMIVFSEIKSSTVDYARSDLPLCSISIDRFDDETFSALKNDFPAIISNHINPSTIGYYSRDNSVICSGKYYPVFPESMTDTNVYINEPYIVYEGRDFEKNEITENKNVVIAPKNSMLSVGDTIIVPFSDADVSLTVIGLSDSFIIPFSFMDKYKTSIFKTAHTNFPVVDIVFEKELEYSKLEKIQNMFTSVAYERPPEDPSLTSITYLLAFVGITFVGIFAAIQVYTLFLYLTSKITYKIAVIEICGCTQRIATAVIFFAIFTYIVAAFIGATLLLPTVINLLRFCHLNYIPTLFDFILSFAVYIIIVSIAVLPGIERVTKAPLARGLNE